MGVRIADEVERRERGVPGSDADLLESHSEEEGPERVRQLRGREEHGERHVRCGAFRREPQREVPDEHVVDGMIHA